MIVRKTVRWVSRLAVTTLCLAVLSGSTPRPVAANPASAVESVALRSNYPAMRLRKVHLVRPDLILVPIFYNIYC